MKNNICPHLNCLVYHPDGVCNCDMARYCSQCKNPAGVIGSTMNNIFPTPSIRIDEEKIYENWIDYCDTFYIEGENLRKIVYKYWMRQLSSERKKLQEEERAKCRALFEECKGEMEKLPSDKNGIQVSGTTKYSKWTEENFVAAGYIQSLSTCISILEEKKKELLLGLDHGRRG
jgi:hypothetical protein